MGFNIAVYRGMHGRNYVHVHISVESVSGHSDDQGQLCPCHMDIQMIRVSNTLQYSSQE